MRGVRSGEVPDSALEIMKIDRDWTVAHLDVDSLEYLRNLPTELIIKIGRLKIHAFHATPDSLLEVVLPNENDQILVDKMMRTKADLYIYAHIHKPFIRYVNGKSVINTGSVGLPLDGLTKSSYALLDLEENRVEIAIIRVDYNLNKVINQYNDSDYPNSEQMVKILKNAQV
ncbi:putative phosphodiesterase [Neobacillus niacini]|nr:putative phosphodiesterase [Neobacillus niacini]